MFSCINTPSTDQRLSILDSYLFFLLVLFEAWVWESSLNIMNNNNNKNSSQILSNYFINFISLPAIENELLFGFWCFFVPQVLHWCLLYVFIDAKPRTHDIQSKMNLMEKLITI